MAVLNGDESVENSNSGKQSDVEVGRLSEADAENRNNGEDSTNHVEEENVSKEETQASKVAGAEKDEAPPSDPMVPFFRLFSMADKFDYLLMILGFMGAAVHGAALPLFFLIFGNLLNGIGSDKAVIHEVNKYALYLVYLGLASWISAWLEVACWVQTGERQAAKLMSKYLQALLRQDVGYFDTDAQTGDFVDSVATDPLLVQDAISEKMGSFIHYVSTFVAGFAVGFGRQWRIGLVTLAVVPLIATAGGFYTYSLTGFTVRAASAYAEAGSIAGEAISQVRTVYSFVCETKFIKAYADALHKTMKFGAKAGLAKGLGMGATYGVLFCSWGLLLWYSGILVRNGTANGGEVLGSVFAVIIGSMSLGQAMPNVSAFGRGRGAAFKIFRLIDHEPTINKDDKGSETLETVQGLIELRHVDFAYPSRLDVPIFKDFSLVIPPGKTVAIVGASGSGKSTVVSLIERFYDPLAGEILLDGHNLKTLNLKWLRGQIGLVNQEPALFATTIAANILYGKDTATQEEIEEAGKAANAHTFISSLPLGYETQVGERGVQLSGGQKQRVAIARAMLKNPTVLLLDEATSALDASSEQVVQEALDRLMVGRTTIVVAHRLSTIQNADSIAVVQQGQIIEMGTHEELISKEEGAYSALVRLQQLAATREGSMSRSTSINQSRLSHGAGSLGNGSSRRAAYMMRNASTTSIESENKVEGGVPNEETVVVNQGSFRRLLAMSKKDWNYILAGLIGSMLAGCLNPIFATLVSLMLSTYYDTNKSKMKKEILKYSLIFVGVGVCSPFVYCLQHYNMGIVGERLVKRVREQMLTKILRNELGWFDREENNSSQISARLSSDATIVRATIGDRMAVIVQNMTLILVSLIIGLVLNWKMTLVIASIFPLLVAAGFAQSWGLKGFAGDQAKAHARATGVAGEAVANIRTVAAFNAEDKVQALFSHELEGPAKNNFLRGQIAGFGFGICECVMFSSYALGLWYAGQLVGKGQATFGRVIRVFFVIIISAFATAESLALTPDIVKGGRALASVFAVLDRKTAIEPEDPDGKKVDKINGDIELKHVSFAYPARPDVIIFKDLNLKVRSGRSLALVGSSGSGKSSVIALIQRFYDPLSGRVLIDGLDLKKYYLKSIRQHIALVMQEPALFATTIYQNILYGKEGASEAEVIEAAKAANAHKFISSLPDGYHTEVGERGVQLSGGQKQRVAIARAVLKDPAILLLDEATSALDAESEKIVQDALDQLMKRRTVVLIAHRLSTIRGADSIAVVQDGAVIEEGSHHELISKGGGYARLINLQNRFNDAK